MYRVLMHYCIHWSMKDPSEGFLTSRTHISLLCIKSYIILSKKYIYMYKNQRITDALLSQEIQSGKSFFSNFELYWMLRVLESPHLQLWFEFSDFGTKYVSGLENRVKVVFVLWITYLVVTSYLVRPASNLEHCQKKKILKEKLF